MEDNFLIPTSLQMLTFPPPNSVLGSFFPRHRIPIAMGFIAPSIIGNIILWKVKTSFASLLGGLYIVSSKSPPNPPFANHPLFP
jgi:hypothetical protein